MPSNPLSSPRKSTRKQPSGPSAGRLFTHVVAGDLEVPQVVWPARKVEFPIRRARYRGSAVAHRRFDAWLFGYRLEGGHVDGVAAQDDRDVASAKTPSGPDPTESPPKRCADNHRSCAPVQGLPSR